MILQDEQVITVWKCDDPQCDQCNENIEVDVTFFQDNGTPVCPGCDCDMVYDHTYLNRDYDGSKCPECGDENINGNDIDAEGADKFYRNCDCNNCGAQWTEEAVVMRCDNIIQHGDE